VALLLLTTALYWARNKFDPVRALVFDYGQQHRVEVTLAKKAAAGLAVECDVVPLPLRGLLRSALLADGRPIPASLDEARRMNGSDLRPAHGPGLPIVNIGGIRVQARRYERRCTGSVTDQQRKCDLEKIQRTVIESQQDRSVWQQ
jgi:hypothetical protein